MLFEEIANIDLKASAIPGPDALWWGEIDTFALSYNGYQHGFDRCATPANQSAQNYTENGTLPATLTELRMCLFFEQRRYRHFDQEPSGSAMQYVRALLDAMRAKVSAGDPA